MFGDPGSPIYGPPKLGETRAIYLDATKAQRELHWAPTVSPEDGLRQVVNHLSKEKTK